MRGMNEACSTILLSVLVPVHNEEDALGGFVARLLPVLAELEQTEGCRTEVVFIDNCSTDATFRKLSDFVGANERLRVYRLSRNVGFQRSVITGYSRVRGHACVQIDCDLEDPPELIIEFYRKWREGYPIVYGIRRRRHESIAMRAIRSMFYSTVDFLSDVHIPPHAGDFRLIDRRIIDIVCQVNDYQPYLRGLIASLGFASTGIEYDRDPRSAGQSSFTLSNYASMALDGILQSSNRPLYLSIAFAGLGLVISIVMALWYLVTALITDVRQPGFATLVVVQLLSFSLTILCIGILSLYVGRIYRQVLKRPLSIVEIAASNRAGRLRTAEESGATAVFWPGQPIVSAPDQESAEPEQRPASTP